MKQIKVKYKVSKEGKFITKCKFNKGVAIGEFPQCTKCPDLIEDDWSTGKLPRKYWLICKKYNEEADKKRNPVDTLKILSDVMSRGFRTNPITLPIIGRHIIVTTEDYHFLGTVDSWQGTKFIIVNGRKSVQLDGNKTNWKYLSVEDSNFKIPLQKQESMKMGNSPFWPTYPLLAGFERIMKEPPFTGLDRNLKPSGFPMACKFKFDPPKKQKEFVYPLVGERIGVRIKDRKGKFVHGDVVDVDKNTITLNTQERGIVSFATNSIYWRFTIVPRAAHTEQYPPKLNDWVTIQNKDHSFVGIVTYVCSRETNSFFKIKSNEGKIYRISKYTSWIWISNGKQNK